MTEGPPGTLRVLYLLGVWYYIFDIIRVMMIELYTIYKVKQ